MPKEKVPASIEEESVDSPSAPANCTGELVQLQPEAEGLTFNRYECQVCHQIVNVGHEDLELNGLPPEHSPVIL